ncbi:MAG: hypothetical protein IJW54_01700 [Clostridia bacterium]|nr:hypothetical protein [Clostridia bacterium]
MRKIIILLAVLAITAVAICSCGGNGDGNDEGQTASYEIKVKDYFGNVPEKSIYVEIYKADASLPNGEKFVKMLSANEEGVATVTLNKGDYHFKLSSADGEFYYDSESCKLSSTVTSKEITIYNVSSDKFSIYPGKLDSEGHEIREELYAPVVEEGATYVTVNGRSYFVFAPQKEGYYNVSFEGKEGMTIGYHGDANYVLLENNMEIVNNSFEFKAYSVGASRMVIALNSEEEANAILLIKYVRELEKEVPYDDLVAKESKEDSYDYNYLNKLLVDFDITNEELSIVKGEDGYYHLNTEDGAIIMVRVASASKYLASFKDICDLTRISCIEKDENGNVTLKESYNDLILTYASKCDGAGICPLTDELIYVIKKAGQYNEWFEGDKTIFKVDNVAPDGTMTSTPIFGVVKENAHLFACCYFEPAKIGGEDSPITIKPQTANENGEYLPYLLDLDNSSVYLKASANGKIIIEATDGLAVLVNNTACVAENGEIVINAIKNDVISISIDKKQVVKLVFEQEEVKE